MSTYNLKNSIAELTQDQINDPELTVIIKDFIIILYLEIDYKCKFDVYNSKVNVYKSNHITAYDKSRIILHDDAKCNAFRNTSVYAHNNSIVYSYNDSNVELLDMSKAFVYHNSIVKCYSYSTVYAYGHSQIYSYSNSIVYAFDNSVVEANDKSHVYANDNSIITSYGETTIHAYDSSIIKTHNHTLINAYHKSIVCNYKSNNNFINLFNDSIIQSYIVVFNDIYQWINYNNATLLGRDYILLYKKISRDYKTQEQSANETIWLPGTTVEMPMTQWTPYERECGPGKFHACAKPIICHQYRNQTTDKYVAIKVHINDVYVWNTPNHPYKLAFRKGEVLYECDITGKQITNP